MIHTSIYILINGSNDLYYPLRKAVKKFLDNFNIESGIEIFIAYSLKKTKENLIWRKDNDDISLSKEEAIYKITSSSIDEVDINLKTNNTSLSLELFLQKLYSFNNNRKILILSGHGGIFQSLLDMSVIPAKSLNTVSLCNTINKYEFELVFLDMCAMNYIEVIYQIMHTQKIKNLLLYNSLAPFNGLDYKKFVHEVLTSNIELLNRNLLVFDKDSLIIMNYVKILLEYGFSIHLLNKVIDLIAVNFIEDGQIKYIDGFLYNDIDRSIYKEFVLCKELNNKAIKGAINHIEYIDINEDGIKNLLMMHHSKLNMKEINVIYDEYKRLREEDIR